MDPLAMVLQPLAEIGTDISASVYKVPAFLKRVGFVIGAGPACARLPRTPPAYH